jgi:hypothetical protein
MNTNLTQNEIKVGDFIRASYACGCMAGIVIKVNKSKVIIKRCDQNYNQYKLTEYNVNITKSRIYIIGLQENEIIIY